MTSESLHKKHVMIVEDEPDFADLLKSILEKGGYTVVTAYNCEDALTQVRTARPDLITLDMQMPRKSGAFFYRTLKSDDQYRSIPVVVVTGVTRNDKEMETLIRSLLETDKVPHPEAYIEKPVDGPRLLATIEEVLSSSTSETR